MMVLRSVSATLMALVALVVGAPPADQPVADAFANIPPTASFASKVITEIPQVITSPLTWLPVIVYALFLLGLAIAVFKAERRTKEAFDSGDLIDRRARTKLKRD